MNRYAVSAAILLAALPSVPADAATFLFIRHAESKANDGTAETVEEVINPPLSALGEQQALALADTLAVYDLTNLYVSGYQRTALTIAPTAAATGLTPVADARTNEWYFGDLESLDDLSLAAVYGVFGQWFAGNTAAKLDLPNAESLDDVVARVIPAWDEIVATHKDEDGVVVLVGHGVSTGYVMPYFARNVSTRFAFQNGLANTGIIQLEIIDDKPYVTNWQGKVLAVPEPATWAMMIGGFGLVGGALRRRRAGEARA
jgi:probable phosphoglycerate mutase